MRSTSTRASWARPPVGLRHADGGEEPAEVVGEVLGIGRGPVDRRHGLVVADAEPAPVVARRPSAVEDAGERAVVGDDEHAAHVEADRIEPLAP